MPKVSSPAVLENIADRLEALDAPAGIKIWAMIETPASILNIQAIAAARRNPGTRLTCFVLGTNDLAKDTWTQIVPGPRPDDAVADDGAGRRPAEGLTILDGVYNNFSDLDGCPRRVRAGRVLGFDGKTLIHPSQVALANTAFRADRGRGRGRPRRDRGLRAAGERRRGAIQINGRMFERQHIPMARRSVAWAEAIAAKGQ